MRPRVDAHGSLFAFAAFGTFWGGWAALLPRVQSAAGVSKGQLGAALLCIGLGALPAMLLTGRAVDRVGARVLPLALVLFAAAVAAPALAGSFALLALLLLVLGAASGAVDVALNARVATIEAEEGVALMQLAHALFSAGVILGALAVGLARQAGGGRLPILAALGALQLLSAAVTRGAPRNTAVPGARRRRLEPRLVALGAVCAAAFVVEGGMENWSALFLERDLGAAPAVSALGPAAFALAMLAGRLGAQRVAGRVGGAALLAAGGLCAAAGLVVASRSGDVALALGGFFLGGAGVSVAAPTLFGAAGRGTPAAERGRAVATVTTVAYLGFLAGPPLVGATAEALGLRAALLVLAGAAALVSISAPRLPLTR